MKNKRVHSAVYADEKNQVFYCFANNHPFEGWSSITGIPFDRPEAKKLWRAYRNQQRMKKNSAKVAT